MAGVADKLVEAFLTGGSEPGRVETVSFCNCLCLSCDGASGDFLLYVLSTMSSVMECLCAAAAASSTVAGATATVNTSQIK